MYQFLYVSSQSFFLLWCPGVLSTGHWETPAASAHRQRGGAASGSRSATQRCVPEQRKQDGGEGERRHSLDPERTEKQSRRGDQATTHRSVFSNQVLCLERI